MSISFNQAYERISEWSDEAQRAGWISSKEIAALRKVETQQAEALFSASGQRPLIVAFFGGTGVGKSSLLNRLAGYDIARTGVERPTSKEVTLFLHRDFELRDLPQELPEEDTVIRYHDDDHRRLVAWLDLPDIDSTATEHREQVERWLPYIDWLVYVVSPERYHDDIGWRFVQERQQHHSWLFIMNHWDEGNDAQLQDFQQRLQLEGFQDPTILKTDCGPTGKADDFHILEDTINGSIRQFGLGFLQRLGSNARLQELRDVTTQFLSSLGNEQQWQNLESNWNSVSEQQVDQHASQLSNATLGATQPLITEEENNRSLFRKSNNQILDLSAQTQRLSEELSQYKREHFFEELSLLFKQTVREESLSATPFEKTLERQPVKIESGIKTQLVESANQSIMTPGTPASRFFYKLSKTLAWLLPLSAAGWVVLHVVERFYLGTQGVGAFLGIDFVTHSLLLVGLSWLIPWLVQRQLKPSISKSLRQGLLSGINKVKVLVNQNLHQAFQTTKEQQQQLRTSLLQIIEDMS